MQRRHRPPLHGSRAAGNEDTPPPFPATPASRNRPPNGDAACHNGKAKCQNAKMPMPNRTPTGLKTGISPADLDPIATGPGSMALGGRDRQGFLPPGPALLYVVRIIGR